MWGCKLVSLCLFACAASGCLLYTDPINRAPTVSLSAEQDATALVRSVSAKWLAQASDPDQGTETLQIAWYRDKTCDKALAGSPEATGNGLLSFQFQPDALGNGCVVVLVTDNDGATASAFQKYTVVDEAPVAAIEIQPSAGQVLPPSGDPFQLPLFDQVILSGAKSYDPDDKDPSHLTFLWSVLNSGGAQTAIATCPDKSKGPNVCTFTTENPGDYRIDLTVVDADEKASPAPAEIAIHVGTDQLPNIDIASAQPLPQTSPDNPPITLFADQDNTFTIHRVHDDGDPYPSANPDNPYPKSPAGFVWYLRQVQTGSEPFLRWTGSSTSPASGAALTLRAGTYLPQQTVQIRVEYRDRVTACQPWTAGCDAVFAACDANATICYSSDLRVEWVTWTVAFR